MGEHKYNPTAQKAKEGLLPKKSEKITKHEEERRLYEICAQYMSARTGFPRDMFGSLDDFRF